MVKRISVSAATHISKNSAKVQTTIGNGKSTKVVTKTIKAK